ncbi:MAG: hypothetical protein BKP49_01090 [Treponema sp. CETP13]|nr:MAG: hypothetical protein BKP49_01090 [Treponema sp. CETP13]
MKKCIVILCLIFVSFTGVFAQSSSSEIKTATLGSSDVLLQGLRAYKNEDWNTALFFLRKAVTEPKNSTQDTWYVLIMTEIFAEDYKNALNDGTYFLEQFPDSKFVPQIEYQNARAYFSMGNYNQAIINFSNFCDKWPDHELKTSAMFWTAESFYQLYQFADSKKIFQKLIQEYPSSSKYKEAEYRLELLNQREREEKLLYLLRVTGEEYLAAREDYERRLSLYENEDSIGIGNQLKVLQQKVISLTAENKEIKSQNEELLAKNETLRVATAEAAESLRGAAAEKRSYLAGLAKAGVSASDITTDITVEGEPVTEEYIATIPDKENEALNKLIQKAQELEELLQPQEVPEGEE